MDELLTFPEAQSKVPVGRTKLYKLIAEGELERIKIGTRTFLTASSLDNYIERTIRAQRSQRALADGDAAKSGGEVPYVRPTAL